MKRSVAVLALAACGAAEPSIRGEPASAASGPAVVALQGARFDEAEQLAGAVLARAPRDARAAAVRAVSHYQRAGARLLAELRELRDFEEAVKRLDQERGRAAGRAFLAALDAIDRDLEVAAASPGFALELCLACWEHDWNADGRVGEGDRTLFELESDGRGGRLAAGDPRRRPTYRFDAGDVHWARAMIGFQRAAVELVLAYGWAALADFDIFRTDRAVELPVIDPARVTHAGALIVLGLDESERSRQLFLAETDDDREWVPSPRQRSYAMPLPVDDALYATWAAVLGDLRRLLASEEGIALRELGTGLADRIPEAYIDVGAMLRKPKPIVIDIRKGDVESFARGLVGNGYAAKMRPSPLVGRLRRLLAEADRAGGSFDDKVRYLLWIN